LFDATDDDVVGVTAVDDEVDVDVDVDEVDEPVVPFNVLSCLALSLA
jgi:hypothetical protein